MKERSTVRDERLYDLDDEFKDKDYFREEWSPDMIKTRVDKDIEDKGSDEEDQLEDVETIPKEEDAKPTDKTEQSMTKDISVSEETERGEEFLYIEKHEQISKVFPGTKVLLIEVAEQGLVGAEETMEPESPDDKDIESFREDWSPDVIDITKESPQMKAKRRNRHPMMKHICLKKLPLGRTFRSPYRKHLK